MFVLQNKYFKIKTEPFTVNLICQGKMQLYKIKFLLCFVLFFCRSVLYVFLTFNDIGSNLCKIFKMYSTLKGWGKSAKNINRATAVIKDIRLTKFHETTLHTLREHERRRKMPVADSITTTPRLLSWHLQFSTAAYHHCI